jgi:hypothetical protein
MFSTKRACGMFCYEVNPMPVLFAAPDGLFLTQPSALSLECFAIIFKMTL